MGNEAVKKAYQDLRRRFLKIVKSGDVTRLDKAFEIAEDAHKKQTRKSGEPYILHPIAVADILLELKFDEASIITALLHDTLEDTDITFESLDNNGITRRLLEAPAAI